MDMSRRMALAGFAVGGTAISLLALTNSALAQTSPAESSADMQDYVHQTLLVGTIALKSSEAAAAKATDPNVKRFAELEVAEQKTIASVLASTEAGKTPPEIPAEKQAELDKLAGMDAGTEFDQAYVEAQIKGHNELLVIQQKVSGETEASVEAITARLAEQAVSSHIAMLELIQQSIGGATAPATGEVPTEGATPAEGAAPAEPVKSEAPAAQPSPSEQAPTAQ
jgi:putative membrane protein